MNMTCPYCHKSIAAYSPGGISEISPTTSFGRPIRGERRRYYEARHAIDPDGTNRRWEWESCPQSPDPRQLWPPELKVEW
jgi:hypothetical protein